jgi:hypothetical protein
MLAVALPQIDLFLTELRKRPDVPAYVKDDAEKFVASLRRWQSERQPQPVPAITNG